MVVKRFKGRVVRHMRRVPGGILLTFLSPQSGARGEQVTITQADWKARGRVSYENTSLVQLRRQQQSGR
jgi:hypothetical protein